jgi:hypothetical protein
MDAFDNTTRRLCKTARNRVRRRSRETFNQPVVGGRLV